MNAELIKKVTEVLKNKDIVEKVGQCNSKEELYQLTASYLDGVTEEEFYMVCDEMKDENGDIILKDDDLEGVAGGFFDIHIHVHIK